MKRRSIDVLSPACRRRSESPLHARFVRAALSGAGPSMTLGGRSESPAPPESRGGRDRTLPSMSLVSVVHLGPLSLAACIDRRRQCWLFLQQPQSESAVEFGPRPQRKGVSGANGGPPSAIARQAAAVALARFRIGPAATHKENSLGKPLHFNRPVLLPRRQHAAIRQGAERREGSGRRKLFHFAILPNLQPGTVLPRGTDVPAAQRQRHILACAESLFRLADCLEPQMRFFQPRASGVDYRVAVWVSRPTKPMTRIVLVFLLCARMAWSDGHGPAFGYGTALLGAGDSSLGTEFSWRSGLIMGGPVASLGLTGDVQLSFSAPFDVTTGEHPVGRFTSMMPGVPSAEIIGAWRFHHVLTGIGSRFESTLYLGSSVTTQALPRSDGPPLSRAPGFYAAAATGHVSRKYYFWTGAGYQDYASVNGRDHQSNSLLTSVVIGWRPPFLNGDYPKPDLRFFWESTGEVVGSAWRRGQAPPGSGHNDLALPDIVLAPRQPANPLPEPAGIVLPDSGGAGVYSGPSVLLTFHGLALQGGVLFALWRQVNGTQPPDRLRVVAGVTYYFLKGRK